MNVAEGRTLTLAGANALTAAKIRVSGLGTVVSPASALSGMLVGGGTVAYTALPGGATVGCDWYGTLAFRGFSITGPNFNTYGNVASRVVLSGIQGWVNTGTEYVVPIVLDNGGYSFALNVDNGNSPQSPDYAEGANVNRCSVFRKISGGGSLVDSGLAAAGRTAWPVFKVYDMGSFSGNLSLDRTSIVVCDPTTSYTTLFSMFYDYPGSLRIEGGKTMTLAEGRTWSVKRINSWGDFTNNGTLSGTGSISFAGRLPGGVYTNDTWTGTVAISNVATATPLNLHLYSGTNSTVQLTAVGGTSAYLPSGNVTAGSTSIRMPTYLSRQASRSGRR